MRILIADDDLTSRTILVTALRRLECDVVVACNGLEAWAAMRSPEAPRLVVLDWMMPEMDGLEVCRRIRSVPTDQPPYVIMLTARARTEDIVAGLEAGANDYLAKPCDARELRARVAVGRRVVELQSALAERVQQLERALAEVRTLRGIIPICAHCKKIRDDKGYWNQVEVYLREFSQARFSHGICPDCLRTQYPEIDLDVR